MVSHVLDDFHDCGGPQRFAADLSAARAAFGADCGYAEQMADAAVAAGQREHAARLRAVLARAVSRATASCAADAGQFTCTVEAACGTGDCRFASVPAAAGVPAGPGRLARPARHARPGEGFGTGPALSALAAAVPFTVGAAVRSADGARARDRPAA